MKKFLAEFKKFAFQGNVLDMAIGVMIGGAISKIVSSLVDDVIMPLIGLITGGFDMNSLFLCLDGNSYPTLEAAKEAGAATLNYGTFLTYVVDFIIMALCIFLVLKLLVTIRVRKEKAPAKDPRRCPYCLSAIDDNAVRCPHCTSMLDENAAINIQKSA